MKALPFPRGFVAELDRLGWTAATMPAGAYGAGDPAVATVAMATSLGFHASVAEDVVHAITSVICDHAHRVRQIHPAARHFDVARAHLQGHGPLHPGAARCFRDRNHDGGPLRGTVVAHYRPNFQLHPCHRPQLQQALLTDFI
jgi:TRAP-type uncharacterized transport system substrate-binding protein